MITLFYKSIKKFDELLQYKSIKALETKKSMVFNLFFTNNTILSSFFPFFLIIDLYLPIAAVIEQIFNPTLALPIPTKQTKTRLITVESKISKC